MRCMALKCRFRRQYNDSVRYYKGCPLQIWAAIKTAFWNGRGEAAGMQLWPVNFSSWGSPDRQAGPRIALLSDKECVQVEQ